MRVGRNLGRMNQSFSEVVLGVAVIVAFFLVTWSGLFWALHRRGFTGAL